MFVLLDYRYLGLRRKAELRRSNQMSLGALSEVLPHIFNYLLVGITIVNVHCEIV